MYKYSIFGIFLLLSGCSETRKVETVKAEVLSINENILEGRLIGQVLESTSGHITNDINKIGVTFKAFNTCDIVTDLKVRHSQLALYRNEKELPVELNLYIAPIGNRDTLTVFLDDWPIQTIERYENRCINNLVSHFKNT